MRFFACCPPLLAVVGLFPLLACGQLGRGEFVRQNYVKSEHRIPMRDGVELHTTIYQPRDHSRPWPILLNRTPYSCAPYGPAMPAAVGPSPYLEQDKYIFVKQDVRGRWNSGGSYDNMRPHVDGNSEIDESSDTYDTIEWLLENVQGHNGRVGITGISYPGFYSAAALPEAHPALVAASPQAPIADFWFDDFHHQGAYILMYWMATGTFGYQTGGPTTSNWVPPVQPAPTGNAYDFYLNLGPLKNSRQYYGPDNFFWQQLTEHPNYDEFWQRRNILPHLRDVHTAVMTVGGWFDAEDLYGPLNIYRTIEKNHPNDQYNVLVMGPFSHGGWASQRGVTRVGNLEYGEGIADFYQREVEAPFFGHFLHQKGDPPDFEALVYDTGRGRWDAFAAWPPTASRPFRLYLQPAGGLRPTPPESTADSSTGYSEFTSDPSNPVPYRKMEDLTLRFTPRPYMVDDQRFATERDDVLVFQSPVLDHEVTLAGDLIANLRVSVSGTDSDWIVKLIDVYPDEPPDFPSRTDGATMSGYQQLVRSEVIRGRFRNSFEHPEPFVPGEITEVRLPLQDVYHTFRPGHRLMVQVQSSWFPLVDRNPQTYVDNIFEADEEDFVPATHRLHHSADHPSSIEMRILEQDR